MYYLSRRWLENYSYQVESTFLPYLIALLSLILVSAVTITRELLRIGKADPVEALRYD